MVWESVALHIAEGSGDTNAPLNRFLQISIHSVKECVVCIAIAERRKYITKTQHQEIRTTLEELSKMITGLKKYLKNKAIT
ncbi:MAG: four helix bundle protein [Maribacter sp.]